MPRNRIHDAQAISGTAAAGDEQDHERHQDEDEQVVYVECLHTGLHTRAICCANGNGILAIMALAALRAVKPLTPSSETRYSCTGFLFNIFCPGDPMLNQEPPLFLIARFAVIGISAGTSPTSMSFRKFPGPYFPSAVSESLNHAPPRPLIAFVIGISAGTSPHR